jgi:hypothetical protein
MNAAVPSTTETVTNVNAPQASVSEEQFANQCGSGDGSDKPSNNSYGNQPRSLLQDKLILHAVCCAERHTYSDFPSALAHRIRNHAMDPYYTEQKCKRGKASYQPSRSAVQVGWRRIMNSLLHGRACESSNAWVYLMNRRRKHRQQRLSVHRSPTRKSLP